MHSHNKIKPSNNAKTEIIEIKEGTLPQGDTPSQLALSISAHQIRRFNLPDASRLIAINKGLYTLFPQPLSKTKEFLLNMLLQHVAYGEQEKAQIMLKKYPGLSLAKGQITDYSGRIFKNITILQYAAWALDYHMMKMILKYIDKDQAASQLNKFESEVTYRMPDDKMESKPNLHFDCSLYLSILKTYIEKYRDRISEGNLYWCKIVGNAQRNLPAHFLQEYCQYQLTTVDEPYLPRTFAAFNSITSGYETLFPELSNSYPQFGVDYAIVRARTRRVGGGAECWDGTGWLGAARTIEIDYLAIKKLYETRIKNVETLKKQLGCESQDEMSKCLMM